MGCGLFTEEMVEGFQKLLARPDVDAKAMENLVESLPVGAPERYLSAVNELLKTEHAFTELKVLQGLVEHPKLQTLLIEEGTQAFNGLMKSAGGDLARAERRLGALDMLKRQAFDLGGAAEYERVLSKLAAGDVETERALRHARRAQQMAGNLVPEVQDLVVSALKSADRKAFNPAKDALRKRLLPLASPEQVATFERALLTSWRVEQLELAGRIQGLSVAERIALEELTIEQWNTILSSTERRGDWFARKPAEAIFNVKGLVAEEVFYVSPEFRAALDRAGKLALERGLDPGSVRLVRRPRGKTISEVSGKTGVGELTDGIIVANPFKTVDGKLVTDFDEMHVLTVIESKSPSNVGQLAGGKPGAKLPKKWVPDDTLPFEANYFGQLSEDFERFSELPTRLGQVWHPPEKVRISRSWTEWIAVHPPGNPIPAEVGERLLGKVGESRPLFDKIKPVEGLVRDDILNKLAEQLFRVVKL